MFTRTLFILLLGFALLVAQATLAVFVPLHPVHPNLLLPIVISLGVTPEIGLARGAILAFILGYFVDSFSACSLGLQTFVFVATFLLSRLAGTRLFLRGISFQVGLAWVVAALAGFGVSLLRGIFEASGQTNRSPLDDAGGVLGSALLTAALAPFVFRLVQRIDNLSPMTARF